MGGVGGDCVVHHPRHSVDRTPLLYGLRLQLGGTAEGGVKEVPVDQVLPPEQSDEGGLEDQLVLLVA